MYSSNSSHGAIYSLKIAAKEPACWTTKQSQTTRLRGRHSIQKSTTMYEKRCFANFLF